MDLCEIKDKEKDQRLHQSFGPELPLKHGVTINRNWERVQREQTLGGCIRSFFLNRLRLQCLLVIEVENLIMLVSRQFWIQERRMGNKNLETSTRMQYKILKPNVLQGIETSRKREIIQKLGPEVLNYFRIFLRISGEQDRLSDVHRRRSRKCDFFSFQSGEESFTKMWKQAIMERTLIIPVR